MTPLSDSLAIVTGANSGVGRAVTEKLAHAGAHVVMICRSRERGQTALEAVRHRTSNSRVALEIADLASPDSVRGVATRLAERAEAIDILVNNAGVYRAARELTPDGFEVTMATNHLGHFLLTGLLLDRLVHRRGRVINVSSESHRSGDLRRAPLEDIFGGRVGYNGLKAYGDSKLANVLFTFELTRRHGHLGITANALHPGVLATRIWNQNDNLPSRVARLFKPFMGRPSVGGNAVYRILTDPDLQGVSGRYFRVDKEVQAADQAYDEELAGSLWEVSTRLTAVP